MTSHLIKDLLLNTDYTKVAIVHGISYSTLKRKLEKAFPLKPKNVFWHKYIPSIVNLRNCVSCNTLKDLNNFSYLSRDWLKANYRCKDCECNRRNTYYISNTDKCLEATKLSRIKDKELNSSSYKKVEKEYCLLNIGARRAIGARYRASKFRAIPSWETDEDRRLLKLIYENKEDSHVDHILPLQGEFICGLHTPLNLQYLTEKENLSKGNRIDLDKYNKEHHTPQVII